ncbi:MAG: hypothetical protein K8I00_03890, partial [Candidatus Omnitrophica bacterium]|nr:hypothetical protein [Candidatus Omnitrophota bacterium]
IERLSESEDKIDQLVAEALNEKNYKIITSVNLRDSLDRNGFHDFVELVNERRAFYMDVENIAMGVTIMPMADAVVSFVCMGHAIDSSNWTAFTFQGVPAEEYLNVGRVVTLTFMYGIGESIVQGVTTPDTFLVHIFPNTEGEMQVNILDRQLGTKSIKAIPTLDVFEALDMNDELLEPYLRLMEGEEVNDALFQARRDASKDDVRKALQKLIELSVDKTADYKLLHEDETVIESFDDLVKPFTFENPDQVKLLAHLIKARLEDRTIKTLFTDVPQVLRDQFSVVDSQVVDVALEFMRAADGYGKLVDIEGAIGHNLGKSNTTVTVQRRESNVAADVLDPDNISQSYTYVKDKDVKTALEAETPAVNDKGEETDLNVGILLAQGVATRNSFSGTIYRINEKRPLPEQFEEIKALAARGMHIIIRTRETTPDYNAV